jgi:hypothetical protein
MEVTVGRKAASNNINQIPDGLFSNNEAMKVLSVSPHTRVFGSFVRRDLSKNVFYSQHFTADTFALLDNLEELYGQMYPKLVSSQSRYLRSNYLQSIEDYFFPALTSLRILLVYALLHYPLITAQGHLVQRH